MRIASAFVLLLLALCFSAPLALTRTSAADVLWDNGDPDFVNGLFCHRVGAVPVSDVADDFHTDLTWTITGAYWVTVDDTDYDWDGTGDMIIYEFTPAGPGAPLVELWDVPNTREYLGEAWSRPMWGYTIDLAALGMEFDLPAGDYFVLLRPVTYGNSGISFWLTSPGNANSQSESYFRSDSFGYPDWVRSALPFGAPYDVNFKLTGEIYGSPDAVIDLPVGDVVIYPGDYVEFAGTATDEDGEIVDWLWTFGEDSGIEDMHVEDPGLVQFNNIGIFTVTFNAQDNDGNWDPIPDERTITVEAIAPDAVIDFPTDDVTIFRHQSVEFAGTATDENGEIVDWLWTFGEGSGIDDMHVEDPGLVQFNNPGVFEVTFNAQDDEGNWDPTPDGRTITVDPGFPDAVIDLPADDVDIPVGESVEFAGTATDENGEIVDWLWTFGEGSGIDNMHVEDPGPVQFNIPGIFTVSFDAQDDDGNWDPDPDAREIRVEPPRIYADRNSPGPERDGLSWDTAFLTIQEGVDLAFLGIDVWVADGTYVENVVMGEGVAIYGGFLGAEPGGYETELAQRDFVNNVTTMDGNQSGDCVTMAVDARVDGFAITNAGSAGIYCLEIRATGFICNNVIAGNSGSGIFCQRDDNNQGSSPTIVDNTITGNSGGIACNGSSPRVTNNAITGNFGAGISCGSYPGPGSSPLVTGNTIADNSGAAIDCTVSSPTVTRNIITGNAGGIYGHRSDPKVTDNLIIDNRGNAVECGGWSQMTVAHNIISGNAGSGVYCGGMAAATVTDNIIAGNSGTGIAGYDGWLMIIQNTIAYNSGGGIALDADSEGTVTSNIITANSTGQGGGMFFGQASRGTATNNTITGNWAEYGGGIFCFRANPTLTNNIVTENSASVGGGGIFNEDQAPTLSHNDFWGNTPNNYEGCEPGEGDISADPLFVNPDAGDFHLTYGSPCIDAGTNDAPELPNTDWDDEDRIINGIVDMGADEYLTYYTQAPDPQPECDGPLFGGSESGYPGWVWFSIPLTPDCPVGSGGADPNALLGFTCNGRLWYWDEYGKWAQVYQPPFVTWDLSVGDSYLMYLETDVINPGYEGITPFIPWTFEFRLGSQGWTWIGMPGLAEMTGDDFMASVTVKYPADDTGDYRTAQADYDATPDNWVTWGWPYWNTWLQAPETFTPYAPFGHNTCYPWVGYRVWINVGTAQSADDPDQVTLIWPRPGG